MLLGLLAGAMAVIGIGFVPFWRRLPPAEFRTWFAANSGRLGGLMRPLGAAATVTAIASAVRNRTTQSAVAAGSAVGIAAITLGVNEPANERFSSSELSDEETTELLDRWARWHRLRMVLGVIGAVSAVRALVPRQ